MGLMGSINFDVYVVSNNDVWNSTCIVSSQKDVWKMTYCLIVRKLSTTAYHIYIIENIKILISILLPDSLTAYGFNYFWE